MGIISIIDSFQEEDLYEAMCIHPFPKATRFPVYGSKYSSPHPSPPKTKLAPKDRLPGKHIWVSNAECVAEADNGWLAVRYGKQVGWVMAEYCERV